MWGVELMLSQLISVGVKTKVVKGFGKINVDTTVQEKAIAFPTDAKLYYRMREKAGARCEKARRSTASDRRGGYVRKARQALVKVGRYAHAGQYKRMKRSTRELRTYLGRVMRDIDRKLKHDAGLKGIFSEDMAVAKKN